jgi:hypothetical protein
MAAMRYGTKRCIGFSIDKNSCGHFFKISAWLQRSLVKYVGSAWMDLVVVKNIGF